MTYPGEFLKKFWVKIDLAQRSSPFPFEVRYLSTYILPSLIINQQSPLNVVGTLYDLNIVCSDFNH